MEKIQRIWDKESNYQPPKINTKFFLLNGLNELEVLVDETPESLKKSTKEDKDDMPDVIFFNLGGSPINPNHKYNSPRPHCEPAKKDRKIGYYCNLLRPNPSQSDGKWLSLVGYKPHNLVDKFVQASIRNVYEPDVEYGLVDMPLEVFEVIVQYLDGVSFLNVCNIDPMLDSLMWGALGANVTKQWKFWRNTCLRDLNRQQMLTILSSYDGILERKKRIEPGPEHPFIPFEDPLDNHTWEDVCRSVSTLWDTLYNGILDIRNLLKLEKKIKTEMQINTADRNDLIERNSPCRITQTSGSSIYSLVTPWQPIRHSRANLRVMEDLDQCNVRRVWTLCKNGASYVKLMYVPQFKTPSDSPGPGLPRVARVLISVCPACVYITPLQEGSGRQLDLDPGNYDHRAMDPILAIHENVFCLWGPPLKMKLYRCCISERGVEVDCISKIEFDGMTDHWNRIANYREFYIPTLEKRKGGSEEVPKSHSKEFPLEKLQEDYYEFRMISLRYGVDIFSDRNSIHEMRKDDGKPIFKVLHQFPQYYKDNAVKFRDALDIAYCGAQGYGKFVVWNDVAVGISSDGLTWIFESWQNAFETIRDVIIEIKNVSHIELGSPDCMLVAVNGNIVILNVTVVPGHVASFKKKGSRSAVEFVMLEPELIVCPIRVVTMDLPNHGLELDLMTFDFDNGKPYIFIILRKSDSASGIDFYIKRICFLVDEVDSNDLIEKTVNNKELQEPEKSKKSMEHLDLEPKLFDLSLYPQLLKRLSEVKNNKENGIELPKRVEPLRKRTKGEPKLGYYNSVVLGRTADYES